MNIYTYKKVTELSEELKPIFKLLSDESKLKIVLHLMQGEECVCNIAEEVAMEQSLVSYHLAKLKQAGLIQERRAHKWIHYSLNKEVFERFEKSFVSVFSTQNISNRKCEMHAECKVDDEEK